MKRNSRLTLVLLTVAMATVTLFSCRPSDDPADADPNDTQAASSEPVARIGDYVITKSEVKQRLAREIRPQRDDYHRSKPPVTAEAVLRKMLAEKAMSMAGRELGYLRDETLRSSIDRFRRQLLIRLFVTDYVVENVPVAESEIDQARGTDPNLSREQAEMKIRSSKAQPVLEQLYTQLLETFKLEKVRENFAQAGQIHQRLLSRPTGARGRNVFWITNKQMRTELSADEKQIVLARFVGGQFTLYEWFQALGGIAPPGRPKDLSTPAGVENFLDRSLKPVIWAAQAVARGYDKKEQFLQQVQAREDMTLLGKVRSEKFKEIEEPSDEQIKAYFEGHKAQFASGASVKAEQLWCQDLEAARKAKQMFAEGATFASVNEAYGLAAKSEAQNVYPTVEGPFWDDLWKAEPNEIVGPVKGFYESGIKWRVVKVLEKTPPVMKPYSEALKNQVRSALMARQREELMAAYEAELLEQYRHEIYLDKIEGIDPLEVTPAEEQSP